MKNNIDKLAVAFVVTIFALTGVTAGYAMWSQELTIDGNITTGNVDWKWVTALKVEDPYCPDGQYYPTPTPDDNCDPDNGFEEGGIGWGPEPVEKNVGCGEMIVVDDHTLQVIINNAYPGYWNGVQTHVKNNGTVPIKIQEAILSWDEAGTDVITVINAANEGQVVHIDLDGNGSTDMEIIWGDHFGDQLELDRRFEISWDFCFLQTLQQGQTYTFYVHLRAVQWNEYTAP